jgi:Flp pilus assembly protein TadG
MRRSDSKRTEFERGQAAILLVGAVCLLFLSAGIFAAFGRAMLDRGRYQRAADLAAVSAARSMRDDFDRLFEPAVDARGRPNPAHLEKREYLERATRAAVVAARRNGARLVPGAVEFPDAESFAPLTVRVRLSGPVAVRVGGAERKLRADASAEAAVGTAAAVDEVGVTGGEYGGPFAYRQGKPMRPDVAIAFDRMETAARRDGVALVIASAFRSDAEQARLYARHPDPKWVARPGSSLHRYGTELDLGPPSAYDWLAAHAERYGFVWRYSWEPWHYGYARNPRSTPDHLRGAGRPGDGRRALPSFVPAVYARPIVRAASRWSVSAALLAAQLYVESNFNPFAISAAGARGIAQFMPATARAYGLSDPENAPAAIEAQAHLMRDLLRRLAAVPLALAAYNAGAAAVERCGCVPPYPETQAYVARVLALAGAGAGGAPSTEALEVRLVS